MILGVADGEVAVAGNFPVSLGHRGSDLVRVEVAAGLCVDETDDIAVADVLDLGVFGVVVRLVPVRVEEPVVVGILVVVASDLLLSRALGVGLDVRVQKAATVAHVLKGCAGTNCNLQRAVLADFGAPKVGLEKRGHLRVAGTAVLKDQEVNVEREEVDNERDDDQADHSEDEVCSELDLQQR